MLVCSPGREDDARRIMLWPCAVAVCCGRVLWPCAVAVCCGRGVYPCRECAVNVTVPVAVPAVVAVSC